MFVFLDVVSFHIFLEIREELLQKFMGGQGVKTLAACIQICLKNNHGQMTLKQFFTLYIDPRPPWITAEHRRRVLEIHGVMRAVFTESNNGRQAGSAAARTAGTLLIVFACRRNVSKPYGDEGSDIDADFHGCRTAEDIDRSFIILNQVLETEFILFRFTPEVITLVFMRKLCGMLFRINDLDRFAIERILKRFSPEAERIVLFRPHFMDVFSAA